MATSDPSHGPGSTRIGSPIRATATLLGVSIAMYLAAAGVVHGLAWPDAAAAAALAPDIAMAPALGADASNPPVSAGEYPRRDSPSQGSERTASSKLTWTLEHI